MAKPACVFCGGSGTGVTFAMFNPRFPPFGTACTACEESLPPDVGDAAAPVRIEVTAGPAKGQRYRGPLAGAPAVLLTPRGGRAEAIRGTIRAAIARLSRVTLEADRWAITIERASADAEG